METWQRELIGLVTSDSSYSARDRDRDKAVLEYLAENSTPARRAERKQQAIKGLFLANTEVNVGTYISQLDKRLREYFARDEARHHKTCIRVLHGSEVSDDDRYKVLFPDNPRSLLRSFWEPYLTPATNFIIYGVPLFVRDENHRTFTRQIDRNVETSDLQGQVCWPFVTHGDIQAAMELSRWLSMQGVRAEYAALKASSKFNDFVPGKPKASNVIAVGSTRVNGILAEYQSGRLRGSPASYLPFRLTTDEVVRVDESLKMVGEPLVDRITPDAIEVPVVITRRLGFLDNQSHVTLIASNHGRAVHQAAAILTDDDQINRLFDDERIASWRTKLPINFQLVLQVEVIEEEQLGGEFSLVHAWKSG